MKCTKQLSYSKGNTFTFVLCQNTFYFILQQENEARFSSLCGNLSSCGM